MTDSPTTDVETLADWLVLTPRRVQQLYKKGIVVKTPDESAYLLKQSVQGYIREINAKADGKNSDWHRHRTRKMKADADQAELNKLKELNRLVNAEKLERALEKAKMHDRQRWIMLRKLAPTLEGKAAQEIDIELDNYGRESLTQLSALAVSGNADQPGLPPHHGPSAGSPDEPVGGPEAQAQQ